MGYKHKQFYQRLDVYAKLASVVIGKEVYQSLHYLFNRDKPQLSSCLLHINILALSLFKDIALYNLNHKISHQNFFLY